MAYCLKVVGIPTWQSEPEGRRQIDPGLPPYPHPKGLQVWVDMASRVGRALVFQDFPFLVCLLQSEAVLLTPSF